MEEKLNIGIEVTALSDKKPTGISNVVKNYLLNLGNMDKKNSYFLYSNEQIRYITNPIFNYYILNKDFKLNKLSEILENKINVRDKKKFFHILALKFILGLIKNLKKNINRNEFFYLFSLPRKIRKNKIDIFIGTSAQYFPFIFSSTPFKIYFIYDLVWKIFPNTMQFRNRIIMSFLVKRNIKRADLIVAISESTKQQIIKHISPDKRINTIPLAADPSIFYKADRGKIKKTKNKYNITKNYILSLCTLEPRKNLKILLEAFSKLDNKNNYNLVLSGKTGWIPKKFFNLFEQYNILNNIIITGYVPDEDLAPLYSGADLFVYPSLYEGFGLPVLEAMQCGCPVITSNTSSMPEIVGNAAILINPCDVEHLVSEMNNILFNDKLRDKMINAGLNQSQNFSWRKSTQQLLDIINTNNKATEKK